MSRFEGLMDTSKGHIDNAQFDILAIMDLPSQRTIVLARHGETDFNIVKKIQDPIVPRLTKLGHSQAQALKNLLEECGFNFDSVVCADTTRTLETLAEVYPNFPTLSTVRIDPRLQERYHRDLVGKTKEDIEKELGAPLNDRLSWHLYFEGTDASQLKNNLYPNDETLMSIKTRVISLIDSIKDKKTTLLIGSSVINQYFLEFFQYGTIGAQKTKDADGKVLDFQKNSELRILEVTANMHVAKYTSVEF